MDPSRLTEQCQESLQRAQALALRRNHQGVDSAHLLAALLEELDGLAAGIFAAAAIERPAPYAKESSKSLPACPGFPGQARKRSRFISPNGWRAC